MSRLVDFGSIARYFESLSDPRHARNRKQLLVDGVVIAMAAINNLAKGAASQAVRTVVLQNNCYGNYGATNARESCPSMSIF